MSSSACRSTAKKTSAGVNCFTPRPPPRGLASDCEFGGIMKKLTIASIVAFAVVAGGAIIFTLPYDEPAKADTGARIDVSQMMMNVKGLPRCPL